MAQGLRFTEWNPDLVVNEAVEKLHPKIAKAARAVKRDIQDAISIWGPPRSLPGEPPHRDTGALWKSFYVDEPEKGAADIGSDSPYVLYLEFGTDKMEPRPHMRVNLIKNQHRFSKIHIHQV